MDWLELYATYLDHDPISGDIFIFINNSGTHIKLLYWDGDGFALYYKRLERGRFEHRTAVHGLSLEIKREELMMLLEGLSFGRMKRKVRYKKR